MNVEPDVGFAKQGPPLCAEDPEGMGGGNPKRSQPWLRWDSGAEGRWEKETLSLV